MRQKSGRSYPDRPPVVPHRESLAAQTQAAVYRGSIVWSFGVCVYYLRGYADSSRVPAVCVITAVLQSCSRGGGGNGGHVLREPASRGRCELVCPSRTNERGGEGYCVKEGEGEEGEREFQPNTKKATNRAHRESRVSNVSGELHQFRRPHASALHRGSRQDCLGLFQRFGHRAALRAGTTPEREWQGGAG